MASPKSGFNYVDIAREARTLRFSADEDRRHAMPAKKDNEESSTENKDQTQESSEEIPTTEMPPFFGGEADKTSLPSGMLPENPWIKANVAPEKIAVETAYAFRTKVFTVWRLWENCPRCAQDISSARVTLGEGEYVCPHTDLVEYSQMVNSSLRGDLVITSREFINIGTVGIRTVHAEWLIPDEVEQARLKRMAAEADRNWVYPPRIDLIFGDKTSVTEPK